MDTKGCVFFEPQEARRIKNLGTYRVVDIIYAERGEICVHTDVGTANAEQRKGFLNHQRHLRIKT